MSDQFTQGLMLGRVLELSERTAAKVDVIESRQGQLIRRIDIIESKASPPVSSPRIGRLLLAALAACAGGLANLKAPQVADLVVACLKALAPP